MGIIEDLINKGKLKHAKISSEMIKKEFEVGKRDHYSAEASLEANNFKWATIQAYYAIFHAARALLYKRGYREESHAALRLAIRELYVDTNIIAKSTYDTLERGMELRELADYKEKYSRDGAVNLVAAVKQAITEIEKIL